jgi:hypothetical protein
MNVEISAVKKFYITNLEDLDPIGVFIEDYDSGQAKVTIEQFGDSWSYYWSHMGDVKAIGFLKKCSCDYLIGKFAPNLDMWENDTTEIPRFIKKEIIGSIRKTHDSYVEDGQFTVDTAREIWFQIDDIEGPLYEYDDLLESIFGCDWWEVPFPQKITHKYKTMERIIKAIKRALDLISEDESIEAKE